MSRPSGYFAFEKRPGDNAWLDLVRAIAIALVLLRHGSAAIAPPSAVPAFFKHSLLNGWVGVDLFFVLSGYLISQHLLRDGWEPAVRVRPLSGRARAAHRAGISRSHGADRWCRPFRSM